MFLALRPASLVGLSVEVVHDAEAVFQAIAVLSSVAVAVGPEVLSVSVLLVVLPAASVPLTVLAFHGPLAVELVVEETAFEDAAFLHEDSSAVSAVVEELSVVAGAVWVEGFSFAVGEVVFPLSLVLVA